MFVQKSIVNVKHIQHVLGMFLNMAIKLNYKWMWDESTTSSSVEWIGFVKFIDSIQLDCSLHSSQLFWTTTANNSPKYEGKKQQRWNDWKQYVLLNESIYSKEINKFPFMYLTMYIVID